MSIYQAMKNDTQKQIIQTIVDDCNENINELLSDLSLDEKTTKKLCKIKVNLERLETAKSMISGCM